MKITTDKWLAEILERDAFCVSCDDHEPFPSNAFVQKRVPGFYYAKMDTQRVADAIEFSHAGFNVVEANVTLQYQSGNTTCEAQPDATNSNVVVRPTVAEDQDAVLKIAESSFRVSRFHLDPRTAAHADRIKREWMANYFRGRRGDGLLVATINGQVAGFLGVIARNGLRVIDLMAVGRDHQRRGAGQALVSRFVQDYRNDGILQVGTQISNIPSLQLYIKCGFVPVESKYVFHGHFNA